MKIGYARVSTRDQNLDMQLTALTDAGCEKIYTEKISDPGTLSINISLTPFSYSAMGEYFSTH